MEFNDEATPRGLDLPRLAGAVWRRKLWIVLPTLAGLAGAAAFVALVKPSYTATTKVMLENGESYFTRPEKAQADAIIYDEMTVESEAEAAKSPDVERRAMAKLKPEDLEEFSGAGGGLMSSLTGHVEGAEDRRVEAFGKRVQVYPQMKTRVLLFEFSSKDRARAVRGANALAEAFLESQQLAKDAEAKTAAKWLSDQIDALRARVASADGEVERLRTEAGLQPSSGGLALPSQQLSEIAAQIASARAAEASAFAKAASLRDLVRAGRLDDVATVAGDESLRRYADSRVALKTQIAELARTLLPGHPRMKELMGQLTGLEAEIRIAAMKRVHGFDEDSRIAGAQVKQLQAAVTTQAKAVASNDSDTVKLRELEIDARTAREQLESYLTKYREAIARNAANAVPANGRIIAYALLPASPTYPKTGPTLLLGPLAAFVVSLGIVVSAILLGDGAAPAPAVASAPKPARRDVKPARRDPALPFGIDPLPEAAREEPALDRQPLDRQPWTPAVEGFVDRLAEFSGDGSVPFLVAGEGETGALPAALVAARRLTRHGRTALIDLGPSPDWLPDLFDRSVQRGTIGEGLSDLAASPAALARATHRDLSSPLDIIPSGAGDVALDALPAVLQALAQSYAFVVVHAADWRTPACARVVADMAAALVVTPSSDVAAVEARARAAFADEGLAIKAVSAAQAPARTLAA